MNDIITIDGVKYKRMEEVKQPTAKYKVGDWVKIIANKAPRPDTDSYIGEIVKINRVYDFGEYKRKVNDEFVYTYDTGEFYVVYEDELEPAEEPQEDPFDIKDNEQYYTIYTDGDVSSYIYHDDGTDNELFSSANACKDKTLMKQRALRETLNRLLWRASVRAGEVENPWNCNNVHYYIYRDADSDVLRIDCNDTWQTQGTCFFPTEDSAQDALDNIVKPFIKEHPDFVW